jgi:hypothetical protein
MPENQSLLGHEVRKDFQNWFGNPVDPEPDVIPFPLEADRSNQRLRRRQADTLRKLSVLLKLALVGGIGLGGIVGAFIAYLSAWGWYSNSWPDPIVFISMAMVLGFFGGLYKGLLSKLRKR